MNRQTKRMMQRQGQMGPDGAAPPVDKRRQQATRRPVTTKSERTKPAEFLREVRGELRRVAWPTRGEVINYSGIVLFTLIILIALIFVLDFAFAKAVLFLFDS